MIEVPKYVKTVMTDLEAAGFEVFVVGGCVRDAMMKRCPNDWDLCTDAKAEKLIEVLEGKYAVIPTGIKHGTVTVMSDDKSIEVTTYRTDGEYKDGRHPESVSFVSDIDEDLKRRDFTINAMAYNDGSGLVDNFGGAKDIEGKIIRCVGDPYARFGEDALRILRALRFSTVLGFEIESKTHDAVKRMFGRLAEISAERITAEVKKIILSDKPSAVLIEYKEVFALIFGFEYDDCAARRLDAAPTKLSLRLALLMYTQTSEFISNTMHKLRFEKRITAEVIALAENSTHPIPRGRVEAKRMLRDFGTDRAADIVTLSYIIANCDKTMFDKCTEYFKDIVESGECYSLRQLAISGRDLVKIGCEEKLIGKTLESILDLVVNNEAENDCDELIKLAAAINSRVNR